MTLPALLRLRRRQRAPADLSGRAFPASLLVLALVALVAFPLRAFPTTTATPMTMTTATTTATATTTSTSTSSSIMPATTPPKSREASSASGRVAIGAGAGALVASALGLTVGTALLADDRNALLLPTLAAPPLGAGVGAWLFTPDESAVPGTLGAVLGSGLTTAVAGIVLATDDDGLVDGRFDLTFVLLAVGPAIGAAVGGAVGVLIAAALPAPASETRGDQSPGEGSVDSPSALPSE